MMSVHALIINAYQSCLSQLLASAILALLKGNPISNYCIPDELGGSLLYQIDYQGFKLKANALAD